MKKLLEELHTFEAASERRLLIEDMSWIAVEDAVSYWGLHPLQNWGIDTAPHAVQEQELSSCVRFYTRNHFFTQKKLSARNSPDSNTSTMSVI
jgi:hypothetical protein